MDYSHYSWLLLLTGLIIIDSFHTVCGTPGFQCYVCSVTSKNYRLDTLNPCIANVTSLVPQQCAANQNYCQVKTTVRYDQIISIERKCIDLCQTNCYRYTFAISKVICTNCCNQTECNIHGGVSTSEGDYHVIAAILILHILTSCVFDSFNMDIPNNRLQKKVYAFKQHHRRPYTRVIQ